MIFIDTSILISYYNSRDVNHSKAVEIMNDIYDNKYGEPLISDYIFDESVTVALIKTKHEYARKIGDILLRSMKIIKITDYIFKEAWKIFNKEDKFSFTDCSSIAIIRTFDIKTIATFDKEFSKVRDIKIVN